MDEKIKGLTNNGNMCFLNVIIQTLWNSEHIREFILNLSLNDHSHNDNKYSEQILEFVRKLEKENNKDRNYYIEENVSVIENRNSYTMGVHEDGNCLMCFLKKFFKNYQSSKERTLDAYDLRQMLISLNDNIQKFNYTGVFY